MSNDIFTIDENNNAAIRTLSVNPGDPETNSPSVFTLDEDGNACIRVTGTGGGGGGGDLKRTIIKSSTIPTADSTTYRDVYMYVGTTDANYTHGYIYECQKTSATYTGTVSFEAATLSGTTVTCDGDDFANFLTEAGADPTPIVSGTMTYDSGADGWRLVGKDAEDNTITSFIEYTEDYTDHGFAFTGTPQDGDVIAFTCSVEESAVYAWVRIDVQPSGGTEIQVSSLPTPSASNVGRIVEYIGTTPAPTASRMVLVVKTTTDPATVTIDKDTFEATMISQGNENMLKEMATIKMVYASGNWDIYLNDDSTPSTSVPTAYLSGFGITIDYGAGSAADDDTLGILYVPKQGATPAQIVKVSETTTDPAEITLDTDMFYYVMISQYGAGSFRKPFVLRGEYTTAHKWTSYFNGIAKVTDLPTAYLAMFGITITYTGSETEGDEFVYEFQLGKDAEYANGYFVKCVHINEASTYKLVDNPSSLNVTLNKSTYESYAESQIGALISLEFKIEYVAAESSWQLDEENIDPADLGITITDTPTDGDTLSLKYTAGQNYYEWKGIAVQKPSQAQQVVLDSGDWSNSEQTVSVDIVDENSIVMVSPIPTDMDAYSNSGVYCKAQGNKTLTFACSSNPSGDLNVSVVVIR